jgi:hypothetical protein
VVPVRTYISVERFASIVRVTRFDEVVFLRSIFQFLVNANVVHSSVIPFTQTMEAIRFSETSVLTSAT